MISAALQPWSLASDRVEISSSIPEPKYVACQLQECPDIRERFDVCFAKQLISKMFDIEIKIKMNLCFLNDFEEKLYKTMRQPLKTIKPLAIYPYSVGVFSTALPILIDPAFSAFASPVSGMAGMVYRCLYPLVI